MPPAATLSLVDSTEVTEGEPDVIAEVEFEGVPEGMAEGMAGGAPQGRGGAHGNEAPTVMGIIPASYDDEPATQHFVREHGFDDVNPTLITVPESLASGEPLPLLTRKSAPELPKLRPRSTNSLKGIEHLPAERGIPTAVGSLPPHTLEPDPLADLPLRPSRKASAVPRSAIVAGCLVVAAVLGLGIGHLAARRPASADAAISPSGPAAPTTGALAARPASAATTPATAARAAPTAASPLSIENLPPAVVPGPMPRPLYGRMPVASTAAAATGTANPIAAVMLTPTVSTAPSGPAESPKPAVTAAPPAHSLPTSVLVAGDDPSLTPAPTPRPAPPDKAP